MEKEQILSAIRNTANANGGAPLGRARFERETGIRESAWSGKFWTRWSDAVTEAGFSPNVMNPPHAVEDLLRPLAELVVHLGHFPTQSEMNLKRRQDPTFPSPDSIRRRHGVKSNLAAALMKFAQSRPEFASVEVHCLQHIKGDCDQSIDANRIDLLAGHIYLLRHGTHFKIGRSTDPTRRYKEIRTQMPLDTEEVHVIETDDTIGIEAYWHKRFSKKRLNGEWFALTSQDVSAFKKRQYM